MTQLSGANLASCACKTRRGKNQWRDLSGWVGYITKSSPGWSRWCISRCMRSEKPSPSSSLSTGDSRPMSQSLSPASLSPRPLSFRLNLSMSCNAYLRVRTYRYQSVWRYLKNNLASSLFCKYKAVCFAV